MVNFKAVLLPGLLGLSFLSSVFASPIAENLVTLTSQVVDENDGWKSVSLSPINERSAVAEFETNTAETGFEKRVFTSPHMKRAFKTTIKGAISGIAWVIDFSMNEIASGQATLHYKLQSSSGLGTPDVEIASVTKIFESENQFRGNAKVELLGKYAGKVVHIFFNGEVFGTAAEMIWQQMLSEPVCYVNGVKTDMEGGWSFEPVYP